MGKARSFSNEANEIVFQTESNNENYAIGSQQNSYNLGSVHFSDQSGIGNFSQSGQNSKFAQVKGSLFQGNIGFVQQTVELDVDTSTINLNNDSTGTVLAVISQDRIVTLSAGTTSDLTTITGAQRQGQRVTLYNIFTNTITIKNDAGATVNTIVTPGAVDFSLSGHGLVTLVFDISLAQWRIEGNLGSGGGGTTLPVVDTTSIVKGSVDDTKLMRFEVDTLVPTTTTVVLTVPAADTTLAGLSIAQTFTANNTFSGPETIITSALFTIDSTLTTIGDAPTDILNLIAQVGSSIIPTTTDTFDIGSASLQWNQLYIKTINATTETTIASPLLTITSALTTFGDATSDIFNFVGRVGTSILPTTDLGFDLGSASLEWNSLFVATINAFTETTISSPILSIDSSIINLGDAITDTINFGGRVNTDFLPISTGTKDLGNTSLHWSEVWTDALFEANIANTNNLAGCTVSLGLSYNDGVRQTFNPNATIPGINFGSHTGDPSIPINGDVWYNSTSNKFRGRENGADVDLVDGGGGAFLPLAGGTMSGNIVMGSNDITGLDDLVFAGAGSVLNMSGGDITGFDTLQANGSGSEIEMLGGFINMDDGEIRDCDDITVHANSRIFADSITEFGIQIDNASATVGSAGMVAIPVLDVLAAVTVPLLDSAFGTHKGAMGLDVNTLTNSRLWIRENTTVGTGGSWLAFDYVTQLVQP